MPIIEIPNKKKKLDKFTYHIDANIKPTKDYLDFISDQRKASLKYAKKGKK